MSGAPDRLPKLLASSVIRGAQLGESHGGLYLVDLERSTASLKLDWNRTDIDISGRGGDRGLRGIAFHGERILVASNAALLVLDQDFELLESFANPYLQHCHEISVAGDQLFLTATGFDSILQFDLKNRRFVRAMHLSAEGRALGIRPFDPTTLAGPRAAHQFHLNSVTASPQRLYFSGLYTPGLLCTEGAALTLAAPLPPGTHNAQIHSEGVLYNDTVADQICHNRDGATLRLPVPSFDRADIINIDRFESAVARPGFARGLCLLPDGRVAGGSSPSTIAIYDLRRRVRIMQHTISMDVRNAIHGLAVWPY